MASLEFDHVTKRYEQGVDAVTDMSVEIEDAEFVVMVGPSGCGKSTALRMVAGLEDVTAGVIRIGNRVVNRVAPKDRNVAMVFQSYALYPHMSVYDNCAFALRLQKRSKGEIRERVRSAASTLALENLLERKPRQLSGGQRQRVALGRAIVRKPEVFLMDEPLSNLDAQLRVQMRVEILRLRSELGATFLYVTHDQVEAMTMGDRIVVMKDGCVQQVGTPREVYERPTNAFVAQFMGSPPMNLLPASMDGTVCAVEGGILRLALAERSLAEAGISPGQNVLVGIRPEGLHDARHSEVSGPSIDCRVELVEMLGSELYVHGRTADHKLTARLQMRSEDVIVGETVRLVVDERQIRLFDADTGRALGDRPLQTSHGPMKSAAL